MPDQFGGVEVAEPNTDKFGGVAVEEAPAAPSDPYAGWSPSFGSPPAPVKEAIPKAGETFTAPLVNLTQQSGPLMRSWQGLAAASLSGPGYKVEGGTPVTDTEAEDLLKKSPALASMVGTVQGLQEMENFFTSPLGIATLGMGALPATAQRAVSLAFAAQMASQTPEIAQQLGKQFALPKEQRDYRVIANLTTQAAGTLGFTAAAGLHAIAPAKPLTKTAEFDAYYPPPEKPDLSTKAEEIKLVAPLTAEAVAKVAAQPKEPNAPQEISQQASLQPERAGNDAQRTSAETGGGGGVRTDEGVQTPSVGVPEGEVKPSPSPENIAAAKEELLQEGVTPDNADAILSGAKTPEQVVQEQLGIKKGHGTVDSPHLVMDELPNGTRSAMVTPDAGPARMVERNIGQLTHEVALAMAHNQGVERIQSVLERNQIIPKRPTREEEFKRIEAEQDRLEAAQAGKIKTAQTVDAITQLKGRFSDQQIRDGFDRYLQSVGREPRSVGVRSVEFATFAKGVLAGDERAVAAMKEPPAPQPPGPEPKAVETANPPAGLATAPPAELSVGPGAASPGDVPMQSQLVQLTQAVRAQSISPKEPFTERLKSALDLADQWAKGKDAATAELAKVTAAKDALLDRYMNLPPWRNFETSLGRWTGADQMTAQHVHEFLKTINRTIPSKLRQEGITNWIQADGDAAILRERAAASKDPRIRKGYETALTLNPAEQTLARNIQSYLESRLDEGIQAGLLRQGVDNYVTQIWKRPNSVTAKLWADLFGTGTLNPNFKYAKRRIFDSYFEGEQAGFKPRNKSIGHLIGVYDLAFNRALSARGFIKELHEGKASDGKPLVMPSGKTIPLPVGEKPAEAFLIKPTIAPKGAVSENGRPYRPVNHWALRDWVWATKGPEGQNVFVQGDLLVHPDHAAHLSNALKSSRLRQYAVPNAILQAGTFAKQTKLSLSPFHTVQEGVHAMAHRVNPINPPELDLAHPQQKALVEHGLMVQDPRAYELFAEGSGGGGLIGKIPGLGNLQQWYTEITFKDYIPRLKMAMALDALERNRTAYAKQIKAGKVSDDQILALTARESNAAFGELNYKMMGRNPTWQDFLRIGLLAPDFLEARGRFVAQALKPYGREQRIALGLMAATLYIGGRILNKTLDDEYHWDKPFSVVVKGKEYRLRTVLGDVAHLITDPRSFWYNRLAPVGRTLIEYATGRNDQGLKRGSLEQFQDFLQWFKPIPLQKRPGETVGQAMMQSVGIPSKQFGRQQEIYQILDDWRKRQTDPRIKEQYDQQRQESHVQSPYQPLRWALRDNDTAQAKAEYQKLIEGGRSPALVRTALDYHRPFAGSARAERLFKQSLTPDQMKIYNEAVAEKKQAYQRFLKMKAGK